MSRSVTQALAAWLAAGENRIGELVILGQYELRHYLDASIAPNGIAESLSSHTVPEAAREIAYYDTNGNYRPLKTAPTLRRSWRLTLSTIGQLHEALDCFYPGMLSARLAFQQGRLAVTPLRSTLERQSGMYAITRKITDSEANGLIGSFCRTDGGCLKTILWPIAPRVSITSLQAEKFDPLTHHSNQPCIPLLCAEACNLVVAKAREALKQHAAPLPPPAP